MIKKLGNTSVRLWAVVQILALMVLAACTAVGASANVCHATGDPANPYQEITIDTTALLNEHRLHANDIFPVPDGGCPATQVEVSNGEITICHATGSEANPYETITVSVNGLNGHGKHTGDIIPVPEAGCPSTAQATQTPGGPAGTATAVVVSGDALTVCHATGDATTPYEALTVDSVESLNEHLTHPNDFSPVPLSGCPSNLVVVSDGQVMICHATGDAVTPYEKISVPANGLDGHGLHQDDVFPVSEAEGCPASPLTPTADKITICHATGSQKNPYVKITVSVNGLNGHGKHTGDIIPAPAGGCPTTKP